MSQSRSSHSNQLFPQTQWSVICEGSIEGSKTATDALESICQRYWLPARIYVESLGCSLVDAEDITQNFFVKLAQPGQIAQLSPEKGRLRGYLKKALRNYYIAEWRKRSAIRRGSGEIDLSFDESDEAVGSSDNDAVYDAAWAGLILNRVLNDLAESYSARGKKTIFELLRPGLPGGEGVKPYAEISVQVSVKESQIKLEAHRLRRRFSDRLKSEVADTLVDPDDLEDELRHLFRALATTHEGGI